MNDLRRLLDTAARAPDAPAAPPADDLTRGRDALRRQWRRRGAVSMAGVAALAVIGVGAATALDGGGGGGDRGDSVTDPGVAAQPSSSASPSPTAPSDPPGTPSGAQGEPAPSDDGLTDEGPRYYEPRTVDGRVVVGPYSFDAVPEGWEIQGGTRTFVTMVPLSGAPDRFPEAFEDKLVIMYEKIGPLGGRPGTIEGRDYVIRGDSGHTTLATATLDGEPRGSVRVQFPDGAFAVDDMLQLLASVRVGPEVAG
ncbi:hypothetical protein [Nocardioides dongkuii]|uniref:hypothetical protein n=1 Tax=Nocardioides dongkuii TaxID=2760089 RepID=UPI0015F9CA48|nr:hypothetical protein [Nocardioides dongkuii]